MSDAWDPFADPAAESSLSSEISTNDATMSVESKKEEEEERRVRIDKARRHVEVYRDEMQKQSNTISSTSEDLQNLRIDILRITPYFSSKRGDEELVALAIRLNWVTLNSWRETVQDFGGDSKTARDYLLRDWQSRKEKELVLAVESEVLLSPSPSRRHTLGEQTFFQKPALQPASWEMQRRRAAVETRTLPLDVDHDAASVKINSFGSDVRNRSELDVSLGSSARAAKKSELEEAACRAEAVATEAARRAERASRDLAAARQPFQGGFMSIRIPDEEEREHKRLVREAEEAAEFAVVSAEIADDARREADELELSTRSDFVKFGERLDKRSIQTNTPSVSGIARESDVSAYSTGHHHIAQKEDQVALPRYEDLLAGLDALEDESGKFTPPSSWQDNQSYLEHNSSMSSPSLPPSAFCKRVERPAIQIKRGDIPADLRAFAAAAGAAARAKGAAADNKGKSKGKGSDPRERGKSKGYFPLQDYMRKQTEAAVESAQNAVVKAEADFLAARMNGLSCDEGEDQASKLLGCSASCAAPPSMEHFLEQMQPWRQSAMGRVVLEAIERRNKEAKVDDGCESHL